MAIIGRLGNVTLNLLAGQSLVVGSYGAGTTRISTAAPVTGANAPFIFTPLATVTGGSYYNTFAAATTVYIEAANGGEVEYDFGAQPALTINPLSVLTGITAHAGGTQALGVPLTGSINRVTVCATGGDSVLLPFGTVGKHVVVFNAGAAACNVFPQVGESIGVGAANAAFSVGISKGAVFDCVAAGIWNVVLSA